MIILKRIIQLLFLFSLVVFAYSYFQKDNLPQQLEILTELYQTPRQEITQVKPFTVQKGGISYNITPLFDYELYGLVVSYNNSNNWLDYYHEKWKDFINIKDLCVIWGSNIETGVYQDLKFRNGSWTCYIDHKRGSDPQLAFSKYKNNTLSNNHLLSDNELFDQKIMEAETGDQVYFKGYLAKYSIVGQSGGRGSSISRDDTGNGACETIYLTDFKIIKKGNILWHSAYNYSKNSIIVFFFVLLTIFLYEVVRGPKAKVKD